jgi:predicted MFS family arabinose efflux permease
LAWLVEISPRERRGTVIGAVLGVGIAGAVGGPVLGAVAQALGPELVFPAVGVVAAVLAVAVALTRARGRDPESVGGVGVRGVLRDRRVWAGTWLTALPAGFFGAYGVLVPLRLDSLGATAAGVAAAFLVAAAVEAVVSPLVGRLSDRRGPLVPLRIGLAGIVIAALLLPRPQVAWLLGAAVVLAAGTAGMLFAPASSLLSHGAEDAGLPQGLVFGLFNFAWAGGVMAGAAGGAALAEVTSDQVPYTAAAVLALASLLTLRRGWLVPRPVPAVARTGAGAHPSGSP